MAPATRRLDILQLHMQSCELAVEGTFNAGAHLTSRSAGILIYGWAIFQKRLTMISARDSGSFDVLVGPLIICAALFIAILANFVLRLRESETTTGIHPLSLMSVWKHASEKNLWANL